MTATVTDDNIGSAELRQFVERIERLEEVKAARGDDIKEVYAELKGRGFDAKAVRTMIALRKKDPERRAEESAILELYMRALGMAVPS